MARLIDDIAEGISRGLLMGALILAAILVFAHCKPMEVQAAEAEEVTAIPEAEELPHMVPLGDFRLTFYCPCRRCSGKWGHRTESGATCQEGLTVAVDKRVIPLGTELYIEGYGYRIAQDTGVKGRSIDIFYEDHALCNRLGVQHRKVYKVVR